MLIRMQRWVGVLVAVVLLSVIGTGCEPKPVMVKVGVLAILSGPENYIEASGNATVYGVTLALEAWEAAGGTTLDGRPVEIELVIKDNGDTPEKAVAAAQELINQEDVDAIIGPQFSSHAIPVAKLAEGAGVPMISPMSTNPETTANKEYVFRVGFIDSFQGRVAAQFASVNLDAAQVAALYDITNAYSKGIAEIFKSSFENLAAEVVAFEAYTPDQPQWEAALENIQASGASVLFLPTYESSLIPQVEMARAMGVTATFLGTDTWNSLDFAATPELEGSFYVTHWHPDNYSPASQAFVTSYKEAYPDQPVYITSALTYDAFGLLINAIEQEQAVTSEAIRAGLANTTGYQGVSGSISYENSGDPEKSAVIMKITGGESQFHKLVTP